MLHVASSWLSSKCRERNAERALRKALEILWYSSEVAGGALTAQIMQIKRLG